MITVAYLSKKQSILSFPPARGILLFKCNVAGTQTMQELFQDLPTTVSPAHTALLVIDTQNDFCRDDARRAMIPRVRRVLDVARASNVTVIYIQNTVLPGGLSDSPADLARRRKLGINTDVTIDGTFGHKFVDELAPLPTETIIRKHRLSALIGTTLDTVLRSNNIQTIICTGTATHGCVINTAYSAVALNYYVVVAEDCVASWRKEFHESALFLMRNTINYVVHSDELLAAWSRQKLHAAGAVAS
jgi:nicotinamidase-related amidase